MKNFFSKYVWVFEFTGAAILIVFGIIMKAFPISLLYIVGMIFIIMGLFRVVPLIKTTESKVAKWMFIVEIVLNVVAGGYLIFVGTKGEDNLGKIFGYIIGIVLYLRAFSISTTIIRRNNRQYHVLYILFSLHLIFDYW